jgi:molecular chaperone GrpE
MNEERRSHPLRDEEHEEHGLALPDPVDGPDVEIVSFGDEDEPMAQELPPGDLEDAERMAAELAEARDGHLRLRADFENYRKRVERERDVRGRRAVADAVIQILPVIDNLERALAAPGGADDLRVGVDLILKQLLDVLRSLGVSEIPALGCPFNPEVHEAVAREEDPEVDSPVVAAELQRGYWLDERLLRPAMVRVALPPESDEEASDGEAPPMEPADEREQ